MPDLPAQVSDPRRLAAVAASGLMDTPAEAPFDELARLAASLLDAPFAFVTVVDERRCFWKAAIGLPEGGARESPIEESFCQYVIGSSEPHLVPDARSGGLARSPSDEAMGVVAWAGAPIYGSHGDVLGSLCVSDAKPRAWTDRDVAILRGLARAASSEIALRVSLRESEDSAVRARVVQTVTEELDAAIEVRPRAMCLLQALVPRLGDFATVELSRDDRLEMRAVTHSDPAQNAVLEELEIRNFFAKEKDRSKQRIPVKGPAELILTGPERLAEDLRDDPELLALAGRLGPTSYLVTPLVARGESIGCLVLGTGAGRAPLSAEDVEMAEELARHGALSLENARLYEQEREISRTLQRSLLPAKIPDVDGIQFAAAYLPAGDVNLVGGDFYDLFQVGADWVAMIGDVCGKGSDAARQTALYRYSVRALSMSEPDAPPSQVVATLNRLAIAQSTHSQFATLILARLRRTQVGEISAACCVAGHPPAVVIRANGVMDLVRSVGGLVGLSEEAAFGDAHITLGAGDCLVLYTDGITEARRDGEFFGEERLHQLLQGLRGRPPMALVQAIERELESFYGGLSQRDDVAVLAMSVS